MVGRQLRSGLYRIVANLLRGDIMHEAVVISIFWFMGGYLLFMIPFFFTMLKGKMSRDEFLETSKFSVSLVIFYVFATLIYLGAMI